MSRSTLHPLFGVQTARWRLDEPPAEAAASALRHLVAETGLVLLTDQQPTDEQLVAWARALGSPLPGYRPEFTHPDFPELVRLGNVQDLGFPTYLNTQGVEWHSDATGTRAPPGLTILNAVETPADGGDTLFTSTVAVWRHLPEGLKRRLTGLEAVHNFDHHNDRVARYAGTNVTPRDRAARRRNPDVTYEVVQVHPLTGDTHLLFSPQLVKSIEGLQWEEAAALMDELLRFLTQPSFVWRHRWRQGDVLLFDNRVMMHSATEYDYADQRRYLRQIIVNGRSIESAGARARLQG